MGNVNAKLIEQINKSLSRQHGENIRIKTDNGYLIYSYSATPYRKDKYEMEKQIEKIKALIERPPKNKKLKFTKSSGEKMEINESLIQKKNCWGKGLLHQFRGANSKQYNGYRTLS